MIVFGGRDAERFFGGRYDPASDTWAPLEGPPGAVGRIVHHAAWTGREMILWSGVTEDAADLPVEGWRFDPADESWTPMSNDNAPDGFVGFQTSVWDGADFFVWTFETEPLSLAGHAYRPDTDEWREVSTEGAPVQLAPGVVRFEDEIAFWGDRSFEFITGALYDPAADSWRAMSEKNQPSERTGQAVVRYRDDLVVWGGDYSLLPGAKRDGAIYDRSEDSWTRIRAPKGFDRRYASAVWTGSEVIFWGGDDDRSGAMNDGVTFTLAPE